MKKCPHCAEEIQEEAIKCKHCSADLSPEKKLRSKKQQYIIVAIVIFVGFILLQSWANSVNETTDQKLEGFQQQQDKIDADFIELNMKACGKTTFCHEDDIATYQAKRNMQFCGKLTDCSDDDIRSFMKTNQ